MYSDIADYRTVLWDRVYITGEVSIPKERSNPGTFDYRRYLKSIGIRCIITAENIENVKKAGGIAALLKSANAVQRIFLKALSEMIRLLSWDLCLGKPQV